MDFGKHVIILITVTILVSVILAYPLLLGGFDKNRWMGDRLYLGAVATFYPGNMSVYVVEDNVSVARTLALGSPVASRVMDLPYNMYDGGWNREIDAFLVKDVPSTFHGGYREYFGKADGYGILYENLYGEMNKSAITGDLRHYDDLVVDCALYSRYLGPIGEECRQISPGAEQCGGLVIGVYFYPWYSVSMRRHWDNTVIDEPLIGYYDSYNETVIKWQLQLIRDAGIDLIVFSWWGPLSFEDNTTKKIVEYLRNYDLKFAIMVEPYISYTDPRPYNKEFWERTIRYLIDNYIEPYGDVYFRLNGKPLILAFNPIGEAFDPRKVFKDYCIRIVGNDVDHGGYRDWDLWPDYDISLTGRLRIRRDGYVALSPRFDDEHFRPGGVGAYDPFLEEKWYLKQWEFVLNNLDEVRIIMIYSWNEYHERSMIEPFIDSKTNIDPWYLYNTTKHCIHEAREEKPIATRMSQATQTGTVQETSVSDRSGCGGRVDYAAPVAIVFALSLLSFILVILSILRHRRIRVYA